MISHSRKLKWNDGLTNAIFYNSVSKLIFNTKNMILIFNNPTICFHLLAQNSNSYYTDIFITYSFTSSQFLALSWSFWDFIIVPNFFLFIYYKLMISFSFIQHINSSRFQSNTYLMFKSLSYHCLSLKRQIFWQ